MFLVCLIFFPALMVGLWAEAVWAVGFCSFFLFLGFKSGEAAVGKIYILKKNIRFFVDVLNAPQKGLLCCRCANAQHNCIQMQAHIKTFAFYAMR